MPTMCLIKCLDEGKCPISMISWNPHVCTSLCRSHVWWNASVYVLWIMMLVMYSRKSWFVSFFPSRLGVCVPKILDVCPDPGHVFTILSVKLWSLDFKQSYDSGNLHDLMNSVSCQISIVFYQLTEFSNSAHVQFSKSCLVSIQIGVEISSEWTQGWELTCYMRVWFLEAILAFQNYVAA